MNTHAPAHVPALGHTRLHTPNLQLHQRRRIPNRRQRPDGTHQGRGVQRRRRYRHQRQRARGGRHGDVGVPQRPKGHPPRRTERGRARRVGPHQAQLLLPGSPGGHRAARRHAAHGAFCHRDGRGDHPSPCTRPPRPPCQPTRAFAAAGPWCFVSCAAAKPPRCSPRLFLPCSPHHRVRERGQVKWAKTVGQYFEPVKFGAVEVLKKMPPSWVTPGMSEVPTVDSERSTRTNPLPRACCAATSAPHESYSRAR